MASLLQSNISNLQNILEMANNLPEASGGSQEQVQVQTTSGDFTSNRSTSSAVTVDCGFKPDIIRFTLNEIYNNMNVEVAVDFNVNGGSKTALALWSASGSYSLYTFIVEQKSTGFSVIAYAYDSSWSVQTLSKKFYYNAIKYTA